MESKMEFCKFIKSGLLTTIQDLGRLYYQEQGVPVGGAMDKLSLRLANILVGNEEDDGAIEITLVGPVLEVMTDAVIAITGGNLSPMINGKEVSMWETIEVSKGDVISFGGIKFGSRSYLAVQGGIDLPKVMNSYSTFQRGNFGGFKGRAFKESDILYLRNIKQKTFKRNLSPEYIPDFKKDKKIRFTLGPQLNHFSRDSLELFIKNPYVILPDSDRMGYRLKGQKLTHNNGADIISEFVTEGSIQVPGDGQPIILMSDCQTTGGYTKIGVVISVDLPYLAQKKPGDSITFEVVDLDTAQSELRKQEVFLNLLKLNNWYTIKAK